MSAITDTVLQGSDKRQFTIRACLGRGGFGEVYRASMTNATGLEADVAVKVLHNDLDIDAQAVERLRDEGRMLGALVHPSIVRVYDLVLLEGRVGLVTEYVEGADLSDCLRGPNPIPPRAVAEVVGQVADALRAAWVTLVPASGQQLNLIHRDVKPANIRIGVQGAVKLLDFGVARSSKVNREAHTSTGHMVGSYLYMAPECLTENVFSRASDVFALGATMFEALAGERLFPDQSLREMYVLVLKDDAYDAYLGKRLRLIQVPPAMESLLRSMLARLPSERATAVQVSECCDELTDTMQGPTLRRWCKKRDWPTVHIIPGMLDGRTITESTMAAALRPDFATAPPTRRKGIGWSTVAAGFGGLSMLFSFGVVLLATMLIALVVLLAKSPVRLITAPAAPPIATIQQGPVDRPHRVEAGEMEPVVAPRTAPNVRRSTLHFVMKPNASSGKGRLKRGGRTYHNLDRIPYGTYQIYVDFGKGYERRQTIQVRSPSTTVTCNAYRQSCQ